MQDKVRDKDQKSSRGQTETDRKKEDRDEVVLAEWIHQVGWGLD